uniref:ZAD domain-containing protein n=1 Tax=Anopheles christyi TaxID=43041 RepID=A0A182KFF7_9DIPT
MERFSINILRQQVYNICRLCGVDNPDKIAIISDEEDVIFVTEEEEPSLVRKIEECVGIKVRLDDQMPQNICTLCVDKVNDFYEYRLMCASTNLQTSTILNLPLVNPSISLVKPEVRAAPELPPDEDSTDTKPSLKRGPKTRNRKKQTTGPDEPCSSEDADSKPFPDGPTEKRVKYEFSCQYCNEAYSQNTELERHLVVKHTPLIHKFGCGGCMEYFDTASEYKDHNLWHKLSRTTFSCFRCSRKFVKIGTLKKHIELNACLKRPRVLHEVKLVPDMRCTLCQKMFKTRNLYEWHGCFMRARSNCPKCGKYFMKKNSLMRHYMLYCTGALPLTEPEVILKEEPGIVPNGLTDSVARGVAPPGRGTEVKRRGRPPLRDKMKEETIELPLSPSLLDLPDVKSETTSIPDAQLSSDERHDNDGTEDGRKRLKSTLVEETQKITTLLRSGASVDGNSDIATINSMLSSVNEAIATISKARKKKKKRDRLEALEAAAEKLGDSASQPMVVLSMANVKQEALDDLNMLANLPSFAGGNVPNGLNENISANDSIRETEVAESVPNADNDESEMPDNVEDSFADGNDDNFSDTNVACDGVEVINLDSSDEENVSRAAKKTADPKQPNNRRSQVAESLQTMPQMVPVKQEQQSDGESDFEGYGDASDFVAVKHEPFDEMDQTDANETIESETAANNQPQSSFSPYQALRIKIKKEKGLHNASVIDQGANPVISSQMEKPAQTTHKHTHGEVKAKKASEPPAKLNNVQPPAVDNHPETIPMEVHIKQEPIDPFEKQQDYPVGGTSFDGAIRIKQEPQNESMPANTELPPSPADIVAFDGTRIKRERGDNESENAGNGQSRKAFNPMSLTGVRLSGSKRPATSNQPSATSGSKPNVMINPFALLKQKSSVPTTVEDCTRMDVVRNSYEGQEASANESESIVGRQERYALPVITQVKSIDPKEHTSSLPFEVNTEPSKEAEEQQPLDTIPDATTNSDETCLMDSNSASLPESVANSVPAAKASELKISSVATIQEGAGGSENEWSDHSQSEQHKSNTETEKDVDNTVQAPVEASNRAQNQAIDHNRYLISRRNYPTVNQILKLMKTRWNRCQRQPVHSPLREDAAPVEEDAKNDTANVGQPTNDCGVESLSSHSDSSTFVDDAAHVNDANTEAENNQSARDCDTEMPKHPIASSSEAEEIPHERPADANNAANVEEADDDERMEHKRPKVECEVEMQRPRHAPTTSEEDAAHVEEDDKNEKEEERLSLDSKVPHPVSTQSVEIIPSVVKDVEPVEEGKKDEQTHCETDIAGSVANRDITSESGTNAHGTTTTQPEQPQDSIIDACEPELMATVAATAVVSLADTDLPESQMEHCTLPNIGETSVVK